MFALSFGIFVGLIVPFQTAINTKLRQFVGSPFKASLIQFLVGTFCLAAVTLLTAKSLFVSISFIKDEPAWIWLGGIFGVFYLTGNILLFPRLGGV